MLLPSTYAITLDLYHSPQPLPLPSNLTITLDLCHCPRPFPFPSTLAIPLDPCHSPRPLPFPSTLAIPLDPCYSPSVSTTFSLPFHRVSVSFPLCFCRLCCCCSRCDVAAFLPVVGVVAAACSSEGICNESVNKFSYESANESVNVRMRA